LTEQFLFFNQNRAIFKILTLSHYLMRFLRSYF